MRDTAGHATRKYAIQLTFAAAAAAASRNMASNTDAPGTIYRWIEKKPLTEAVSWTSREKFWLMTAACNYGTNDWRSVAQVVRNSGEPYRPRDWYTSKNCERQFKIIVSNASKELKSLPLAEMLQQIAGTLQADYIRDASKSKDILKTKYCNLFSILNRVKQGNLSRNEVVNLYSQARRNEIDGKQYMEQLMTRQNASLASENLSSGLPEEPIKWNTPSAPLLTSLLRSRNTIPANRTVTNITSLLQSPGGTSRTRSGKLLPLSSNVRTTQGTPTLSKLLEAPANPYIPSPSQSAEKNKQSEIDVTEKLVGNTPRKENSQSTSLNRVQVDNITTPGSFNQLNKSDLSASKRQTPKSPISAIKNGSNVNSNIVNLLSDSENEDDDNSSIQNIQPKNVFGEKKDISTIHKIEPRATRSQTRAEGSFKQINDNKLSDGKKQQILRQQSGESQITENNLIDDELIDIDQIEIEPLPSVQDEITTQTPSKVTRLSMQRLRMNSSVENILTNKVNTKKISNKMLEEISANFVLNSTLKNVATDYKNVMVGQSRIDNSNISGRFISIDGSAVKDNILLPKDGQSFPNSGNTLTTLDAKLLKQKRIIELKGANIKCIDGRNDAKFLSFANQPIVVVNKLKKPYNIKLGSELKDKTDDIQVINNDAKKNIKLHNNSQNLVQLLDGNCSFDDDVIIIDDDVNINDDSALTKTKEICSKTQLKNLPLLSTGANDSSNLTANLKPTGLQLNENKPKNDKTSWKMFEKTQESSEMSLKKSSNQDISKTGNVKDTNSQFIKELDFDFDQSISQASLSELYNGVEEIVEMHSFDNEELNSLIECGSLDSSEIVEHRNPVSLDRCESSVSESGSTIGAFDTFAQITGVSQMPSTSKDMKSISRESRTAKQRGKNLEGVEGFVQSDEIDDDHSSTVSVTGIPILQGVISDVMSRIDSDRNAALKAINQQNVLTDEIVEISSDEEEEERNSDNTKQHSSNVINERIKNQECTKEFKKLKADKIKIIEEPKFIKLNYECETDNIKVRQINNSSIVIKNDKSDIINVKSRTLNMIRKSVDNKLMEIVSIESKKEIDSKIVEDKLIKTDKTKEINVKKKDQVKLRQDEVLKTTKDAEEKLTKKVEVRKEKDEEQSVKNTQKKEVEIKESKTEIMNESEPPKNEIKNTKGMETIKLKEIELIKRVKEAEMKNTKETEIQKAKEGEVRKPKETELQREREAQVQKEKEAVIQREKEAMIQKEIEIQRAKEEEIKNAKEEEIKQAKEDEIKKAKEEQIKRAKEEELKKAKYEEIQRAKEEEAKIKNEEINNAKEEEIKRAKEAEIKKAKEEELRKAEEEAELNKNKEAELRKAKEIEQRKIIEAEKKKNEEKIASAKEVELEKIKNKEVVEEEIKKAKEVESLNENKLLALEEQSKKSKKIEHSEIKKTNIKESESETIKLKEQDLKKISENEEKIVKETETKIITRKRGLKIEEKIKESNIVLRNINKSCTPIKSSGQLSTNVENSSISNHDCRKSKQVDDEIKVNQNKLINSEVVVVLDDCKTNQNEIGSKLRTRSSTSLKQVKLLETKSTSPHKSGNEEHEVGLFPNVVGTKTKTLGSHHEIPTTSSNIQNNTELCGVESTKLLYDNMNSKQLVVVLSPDDVLNHGDDIGSDHINISSDKPENNVINNEHILQKTIDDNENMEKPTPKKRGRKRRIDVQNEQLQLPNSDKSTLQNGSTIAINQSSTTDVEPPAKRTRRNTETRESKKETVEKKHEDEKNSRLRIVRILFDSLCVNLKYYISRMEAQLKDVSLEHSIVTKKMPFRLEDIKRKVYAGEILKVSHLQVEFMTMAFNVLFSTKSNTSLYDDVTNFQTSLIDCCQVLMNTIDDKYNDDDEDEEEEDDDDNDDDDIYQDEISKKRKSIVDNSIDNNDDSDDTGDEQTTTNNIVNTYISSGESSDDSDSSPAKMRKIKYSFSDNTSTYDEDSDDNDSNVT